MADAAFGLIRSLLMYYAIPLRAGRMARFYGQFLKRDGLAFDLGAHAGNRVLAFRRIGARVLAVEPQPQFARLLRTLYGRDRAVTILEMAVGAEPGEATMHVSTRTPTVTTLSTAWAQEVGQARSFAGVRWEDELRVPLTTLDALIAAYGAPDFCKIDVEGYELEVLRGLSRALPVLSVEVIPAALEVGLGCVERLAELGEYRFNWSRGESHRLAWEGWLSADETLARLRAMGREDPSGDLYARDTTVMSDG